jgi:hypothetical protein
MQKKSAALRAELNETIRRRPLEALHRIQFANLYWYTA